MKIVKSQNMRLSKSPTPNLSPKKHPSPPQLSQKCLNLQLTRLQRWKFQLELQHNVDIVIKVIKKILSNLERCFPSIELSRTTSACFSPTTVDNLVKMMRAFLASLVRRSSSRLRMDRRSFVNIAQNQEQQQGVTRSIVM